MESLQSIDVRHVRRRTNTVFLSHSLLHVLSLLANLDRAERGENACATCNANAWRLRSSAPVRRVSNAFLIRSQRVLYRLRTSIKTPLFEGISTIHANQISSDMSVTIDRTSNHLVYSPFINDTSERDKRHE